MNNLTRDHNNYFINRGFQPMQCKTLNVLEFPINSNYRFVVVKNDLYVAPLNSFQFKEAVCIVNNLDWWSEEVLTELLHVAKKNIASKEPRSNAVDLGDAAAYVGALQNQIPQHN